VPANRASRTVATAVVVLVSFGVLAGCGDDDSGETVERPTATEGAPLAPAEEQPLSPAEERGRMLFVENCGSCHTLDAAGTVGQIGPNLGDVPLDEADVRRAIEIGGEGSGNMPRNIVTGADAADVAAFVAASGPGASGP
jgi:mono/diheme cytochrome c family protein